MFAKKSGICEESKKDTARPSPSERVKEKKEKYPLYSGSDVIRN